MFASGDYVETSLKHYFIPLNHQMASTYQEAKRACNGMHARLSHVFDSQFNSTRIIKYYNIKSTEITASFMDGGSSLQRTGIVVCESKCNQC